MIESCYLSRYHVFFVSVLQDGAGFLTLNMIFSAILILNILRLLTNTASEVGTRLLLFSHTTNDTLALLHERLTAIHRAQLRSLSDQ